MYFSFNLNKQPIQFDIGNSRLAATACDKVKLYQQTGDYEAVKQIFAILMGISDSEPTRKFTACLATQAFATQVYPTLKSPYERLFVTISVTSIFVRSKFPMPRLWYDAQALCGIQVQAIEHFNLKEAERAGLVMMKPARSHF